MQLLWDMLTTGQKTLLLHGVYKVPIHCICLDSPCRSVLGRREEQASGNTWPGGPSCRFHLGGLAVLRHMGAVGTDTERPLWL